MELDTKSPVTLYYQVELQIRRMIENGDYQIGDAIPGENELIKTFNVSRITVRKALDRLEEDGLITKKRGSRSVVSSQIPRPENHTKALDDFRGLEDELRHQGFQPKANVVENITVTPSDIIAEIFQTHEANSMIRVRRICSVEDIPIWIESRYFPKHLGERLQKESLENESVQKIMKELGYSVDHVEIQISAVSASSIQSKQLKIPLNFPLLLHQSISYDNRNTPLQLTRVYLHSDYYKMVLFAKPKVSLNGLDIMDGGYSVKKPK